MRRRMAAGLGMVDSSGLRGLFVGSRGLWALAAIAIVSWAGVGLLQWQRAQPKFEDNWQQLCGVTDCTKYREGFTTIELADAAFKVPFSEGPVQLYLRAYGDEFLQADRSGRISRSVVRNAQRVTITPCCGSLSDLLPSPSYWFVAERVDIYASNARWADDETRRTSKTVEEHPVLGSWSDELDLLYEGSPQAIPQEKMHMQRPEWAKARGTQYTDLLLVTKAPVAFGRRALLRCGMWSCDVNLLQLEGQTQLPVFVSIPHAEIQPTADCTSQPEGCLTREQEIRNLPAKLRNLEALLLKLSA